MDKEIQETADLICSLQAKKLALLFFGRKTEFLKFMEDAYESINIAEDEVPAEFKKVCLQIALIDKKLRDEKVQLISLLT